MSTGESRSLQKLEGGWLGPVHIEERPDGTRVAVKTIQAAFLKDSQAWSRLAALAAAQKQPADPGLVAVLSCTQPSAGAVAWTMPFVEAEDLASYLARQPAQAADKSLWIGQELARLLSLGQQAGYHHLALRPSQVLIAPSGAAAAGLSVSLLGLGVMQALGWQRGANVPASQRIYLAPEQAATAAATIIDERSDVYALGVLLLHLLQGKMPTPDAVARARSQAGPLLSARAIRPDTVRLVSRMLLPEAAQRPTLQEVVQALRLENQAANLNATLPPDSAEQGPVTAKAVRTPAAAPRFVTTLPPLPESSTHRTPNRTPNRSPNRSLNRPPGPDQETNKENIPPVRPPTERFVPTLPPEDLAELVPTPVEEPVVPGRSPAMAAESPQAAQSGLEHAGLVYGNFRIVRRIGRGGMGVVYEAEHRQIGRRAAVKILHPSFAAHPGFATRFLNEARAVNIVRHPGLVEIFEYGQQPDGTLYIVMELLQGESLRALLQKQPEPYPISQILGWSVQIARALCATHEKGIIHRDLKPENIMVIPDPLRADQHWVKLLDFGIAKVGAAAFETSRADTPEDAGSGNQSETAAGTIMGTPVYMAPEQDSSAATVDGMADVFSFGVMLYEMIAGQRPYEDTWLGLRTRPAEPLSALRADTPPELSALVLHMLALAPAERPTMAQVQERLAAVIEKLDAAAPAAKTAAQQSDTEPHRRRTGLWLSLGGFVAVLFVLAGFLGYRLLHVPTLAQSRERALRLVQRSLKSSQDNEELQAVQALGRSRDNDYRSLLEPVLGDAQAPLVAAAARGLGDMSAVESQGALLAVLDRTQNPAVRLESAAALAQLSHPKGLEALRALLQHVDDSTKLAAALRLLEFGDPAGAELLHKGLERPGLDEERKLPVLAGLARAGDPQARQRLAQRFQAALAAGKLEPLLAFSLARLGEPAARRELARVAGQAGPDQLIAARLLAALGQPDGYAVLLAAGADEKVPERLREVAFEGLGDSGQTAAASLMARTLEEAAVTSRFRLTAAGSILQLAGGVGSSSASRSLSWARAALASDSGATRELAVMLLGDLESAETLAPLQRALKDQDRQVRSCAARALGHKTVQAALDALADALDDADEEVRSAAMRSIGQVAMALQNNGERGPVPNLIARLQQLIEKGSAVDRIVAAGTLLLLGDRQQLDILRQGLRAASALVRRLAVELLDADPPLLLQALKDSDSLVRLAAARRLAALGLRDGIAVLRAALTEGGLDGLAAYGLLRKLGEAAEPPADLLSLFAGRSLREKELILSLLPALPPDIALDLLLRAAADGSNMVRRRSAKLAFDLFLSTWQNAFRHVLLELRNDPDMVVRLQAIELCNKLPAPTAANSRPDGDRLTPHASLLKNQDGSAGTTESAARANPAAAPAAPAPTPSPASGKTTRSAAKAAAGAGGAATKVSFKNDPRSKIMGLVQVFVMKKGRCQMAQQYYLPPGDHILNLSGGASQTVSVNAGSIIPIRQCP